VPRRIPGAIRSRLLQAQVPRISRDSTPRPTHAGLAIRGKSSKDPTGLLSVISEQSQESASIEETGFVCSLTSRGQEAVDARIPARFVVLPIPGEHILDRWEQFMMSGRQLEDMSRTTGFGIVELQQRSDGNKRSLFCRGRHLFRRGPRVASGPFDESTVAT
jgi:hypothetical protein